MMDRRSLLKGFVVFPTILFTQKRRRRITVLESLETEGVRYTLEYFPDRSAYYVSKIFIEGRVFHDLTFEVMCSDGRVWRPEESYVSVGTFEFIPWFEHIRWKAQKGNIIVPL